MAARFSGPGEPYEGLAKFHNLAADLGLESRWTGEVRFIEERLEDPIRWKRPRMIFVNSMSDLFHEKVDDNWIDAIFAVMSLAPRHTFQCLTKRPQRMMSYLNGIATKANIEKSAGELSYDVGGMRVPINQWPLPNVWIGVSVEDQKTADERIPLLLETPAAVRWVSYEPALAPVDFTRLDYRDRLRAALEGSMKFSGCSEVEAKQKALEEVPARELGEQTPALNVLTGEFFDGWDSGNGQKKLDWIVVGGESGPEARPFDLKWARDTIQQCKTAGVACFVKQLGSDPFDSSQPGRPHLKFTHGHAGDMSEWPEDLRLQEFPNGTKAEEGRLPDLRLHAE